LNGLNCEYTIYCIPISKRKQSINDINAQNVFPENPLNIMGNITILPNNTGMNHAPGPQKGRIPIKR
jgi:hypothetical protein